MRIRDYVTGRVVAWAIIALLGAWFGIGRADAASCGLPGFTAAINAAGAQSTYPDREEAGAACMTTAPRATAGSSYDIIEFNGCRVSGNYMQAVFVHTGKRYDASCVEQNGSGSGEIAPSGWYHTSPCPEGTEWRQDTGSCFDPQDCTKRNQQPGFINVGDTVRGFTGKCINGCQFEVVGPHTITGGITSGHFEWTGVCTSPPSDDSEPNSEGEAAEPKPQECMPAGDGQTMCQKPNGDQCYSASTGKQICWNPGETGEKTDGPDKQKRDAGDQPIPPPLELPSGDTLEPSGPPMTTTTTSKDGGGNVTIITTTTTNYTTQSGTNAGDTDSGENADGTGGEEGEGDEDGDSATGGECGAGWTCAGDPIACAQLREANMLRCRTETDRQELTADHQANGDGPTYTKEDAWMEPVEGTALDSTGFGWGTSCPALPVIDLGVGVIDLNNPDFCQWVFWLSGLFQLVALVWGLHIVGS